MQNQIQRLFVDMDGVLAVYDENMGTPLMYEPNYFLNLKPQQNVINAIRILLQIEPPSFDIHILSSTLINTYAPQEKKKWINKYLPNIPSEKIILLPIGQCKTIHPIGIRKNDILLDDFTPNLQAWSKHAIGIKLLNGINHTRGTWQGKTISIDLPSSCIARDILDCQSEENYEEK